MAALTRRTLIATLAAAAAAGPSLFAQENVAGKPAPDPAASIAPDGEFKRSAIIDAGDYSVENVGVGIAVLKGRKEEIHPRTGKPLTGQDIGNAAAGLLKAKYDIRSEVFVERYDGDYSSVGYLIKGRLFGPYGLIKAGEALPVISMKFDQAHGFPGIRAAIQGDGKPAPGRD